MLPFKKWLLRVLRPFYKLKGRAFYVFYLRLLTSTVLLITLSILLGDNFRGDQLYVARIDCQRDNLATGLFNVLQEKFKSKDSFISTSEILILAKYTAAKIRDTPEVIYSHLHYSCYKDFNVEREVLFNGVLYTIDDMDGETSADNSTLTCLQPKSDYTFDYRKELSNIGLNIILAYAYGANFQKDTETTAFSSNIVYEPSTSYVSQMKTRQRESSLSIAAINVTVTATALLFVATVVYYSFISDDDTDDSKIPSIWKHLMGCLSTIILIFFLLASLLMEFIILYMQKQIHDELSQFGIYLYFGRAWFGLLWFSLALAFTLFSLWGGSIWCNRSAQSYEEDEIFVESVELEDDNSSSLETQEFKSRSDDKIGLGVKNPFEDSYSSSITKFDEGIQMADSSTNKFVAKSPIMLKSFFESSSPIKKGDQTG